MKARIIIPVWGDKYLQRMDAACLPALLAPGNLPHLAELFECELVIVTESKLFDTVRQLSGIQRAGKHAGLRLVSIDDKMSHPHYYGLTITHALFRGFSDLGDAAKDVWCLFLNADFILADGSYRSMVPKMLAGERCIFAPSYCAIEEDVFPLLKAAVTESGVLSMAKRDMASLILDHKHFTIRAKIINWQMYRIDRVDQFYYHLDNDTLIGRQLPIAIVAFRPERVPPEPVAFWDYGIVAEICPTSPLCVLGDSDDFLMLELRGRDSMREQFRLGWMDPEEIANDLSRWTTKDQRDCGEFTLVLHRKDLPSNYQAGVEALEQYYRDIFRRVAPQPRDHRSHYIWTGVADLHDEWLLSRGENSISENAGKAAPAQQSSLFSRCTEFLRELLKALMGRGSGNLSRKLFDFLRYAYLGLFGRYPEVGPLHPRFVDLRDVLKIMHSQAANGATRNAISVWAMQGAAVAPYLSRWVQQVINCKPDDLMAPELPAELIAQAPFDLCYLELTRDELAKFAGIHARLRPLMRKGGEFVVLYRTQGAEHLAEREFRLIADGMPASDIGRLEIRGSLWSYMAQNLWDKGAQKAARGGLRDLIQLPFLGLAVLLCSVVGNRKASDRELGRFKKYCTSLQLKVTVV